MELREPSAKYLVRPGYKQTEVGVIPEDWEVASLGTVSTVVRGGSPRPAGDSRYFNGSFIPWLTVASLTNIPDVQLVVSETATCLTEEGSRRSRTLSPGTLIVANSGATLGVAKILGIKCCANDGIAALQHVGEDVDVRFVAHFINTQTSVLREVVATGNGQPNLNTGLIGAIRFPLPPNPKEQQAIADALGDADALIESLEHLLAKQRLLRQATIQALLTGERRLPGFDGAWRDIALGETGAFLKGSGVARDDARSGDLPCIRYGEIYTTHDDVIRDFQSRISPQVAAGATRLKQGDILFAGSGETKEDIGKCVAFVDDCEAYAGGDIVILRAHGCDPVFLGYALNTPAVNRQKASFGQGDAVVHISASALAQVVVRVPALAEQTAIATVLSDLDAEIAALKARIAKARLLKQGMMQELLTGRIRLV